MSKLQAGEPVLMPNQDLPFNGDIYVAAEFLKLQGKYNITCAIELGSCVMGSTKWLSENFNSVLTVEIVEQYRNIGLARCQGIRNIKSWLGDSVKMLPQMISECSGESILIFIDSHWEQHFPLMEELELIAQAKITPVIIVHDCLVPCQRELGYDSYNNVDISFENMKPYLDKIYGSELGYGYHYNTNELSTEVKRGVIYIYPVKHI